MTNQNFHTNRHGTQNKGYNQASADSKHCLVSKDAFVKVYVTECNDVINRHSNVITIWRKSAIEVTALFKKTLHSEIKGVQEKESVMGVRGR